MFLILDAFVTWILRVGLVSNKFAVLILNPATRLQIIESVTHHTLGICEAGNYHAQMDEVELNAQFIYIFGLSTRRRLLPEQPFFFGIFFQEFAVGRRVVHGLDSAEIRPNDLGARVFPGFFR